MRPSPVGPRLLLPDKFADRFGGDVLHIADVSAFLATPGDQIDAAPGPYCAEQTT